MMPIGSGVQKDVVVTGSETKGATALGALLWFQCAKVFLAKGELSFSLQADETEHIIALDPVVASCLRSLLFTSQRRF